LAVVWLLFNGKEETREETNDIVNGNSFTNLVHPSIRIETGSRAKILLSEKGHFAGLYPINIYTSL
jgi:hypothetical protein